MLEPVRVLTDEGDGTYRAMRLVGLHDAGKFMLVISTGPAILWPGDVLKARRQRIGTAQCSELVYVVDVP